MYECTRSFIFVIIKNGLLEVICRETGVENGKAGIELSERMREKE